MRRPLIAGNWKMHKRLGEASGSLAASSTDAAASTTSTSS
jgi:triosephosphate isomerase